MREKILLIDDDDPFTEVVSLALENADLQVQAAHDGLEGLRLMYQWRPDLVILDVMMPNMDGWETCRRIREISDIPLLILTAKGGDANELRGLDQGADQYMTKPFAMSVLVARVRALLRRSQLGPTSAAEETVATGELEIDLAAHEVRIAGRPVDLSPTEFKLLAALAARAGKVVPRRDLLMQVWGPEYAEENLYLNFYIRYLRQKLEPNPARPHYILTRRGVGYCLSAETTREQAPGVHRPSLTLVKSR